MGQIVLTRAEFERLVTFVFLAGGIGDIVIKHSSGGGIGTVTTAYIGDKQFDITEYEAW